MCLPNYATYIATGVLAPQNVKTDLMSVFEMGKKAMSVFVEERLDKGETSFFDPIHKLKLKTFAPIEKNNPSQQLSS